MSVASGEVLRAHRFMTVAVVNDSQESIRWTTHLDPWPGQHLTRAINEHARALRAHGIEATIDSIPGNTRSTANEEADRQANEERDDRGYTVPKRIYSLAAIELDGSPMGGQRQRRSGRPRCAPNTTDID
jgi:hypothetical protein